jgi:1-acyl-sn-glycerol-3-phosphate acyltransferase
MTTKALKILQLVIYLLYGITAIFFHTKIKGRKAQDPIVQSFVKNWFSRSCQIVGLSVRPHGEPSTEPVLFIANHVSWLDIPLVGSLVNPRFLSKAEVRNWPVIGWLGEKVNTLFIVRGGRSASEAASAAIVEGLEAKDQILIFPEGTTTDGKVVGRLFPRLFGAPIKANAPIQPIVIHYTESNSDAAQSERVPYIGDQTLIGNLWAMLGSENLIADVYFLPPVDTKDMPRKELANILQTKMQLSLQKSQSGSPLSH